MWRLAPERRNVSLVYQDHALFPHLNVLDNVMYGQRYHGMREADGRREALALLDRLGLSHLVGRSPAHLSGGEKQRSVSLARALACKPDVVLLDEPLSSLDPQFRDDLRTPLKNLHRQMGLTFLMVTHDFVDALTLADRAAVIKGGRLERRVGAVGEVFRKPATALATFVGMKNIFSLTDRGGCDLGAGLRFAVPCEADAGCVALRPEDVFVARHRVFPHGLDQPAGAPPRLCGMRRFSWFAEVSCGQARFTAAAERRFLADGGLEREPRLAGFRKREPAFHATRASVRTCNA